MAYLEADDESFNGFAFYMLHYNVH